MYYLDQQGKKCHTLSFCRANALTSVWFNSSNKNDLRLFFLAKLEHILTQTHK